MEVGPAHGVSIHPVAQAREVEGEAEYAERYEHPSWYERNNGCKHTHHEQNDSHKEHHNPFELLLHVCILVEKLRLVKCKLPEQD